MPPSTLPAKEAMFAADRELIRRDPDLPGLASLLDEGVFLEHFLIAYPEHRATRAKATYIRYKPHTSSLVKYQVQTDGGEIEVYAKTYRFDIPEKPAKDAKKGFRLVGNLSIALFPVDRKLRLQELVAPQQRQVLLQQLLPLNPGLWQADLQTLAYKPERRYVGRLLGERAEAVVRVYANNAWRYQSDLGLATSSTLQLAQRLGQSDQQQMLVMEWLPGQLLREAMRDFHFIPRSLEAVGRALAELHQQQGSHVPAHPEPIPRLEALVKDLSFLTPQLAGPIQRLSRHLIGQLDQVSVLPQLIHGDFYDKQILLCGERVGILDFDEAAWGHPAYDLGLFMAHLERDHLLGQLPLSPQTFIQPLLQGYGQRVKGLETYTALGLLSLAPHPFRNRLPNWPQHIAQIIALAEQYAGKNI